MKKERQISDELLVKYLLGEASGAEQGEVQQWISESPENKDQLDSFRLIWNQSSHLAAASAVDENEAWERFKQRTLQPAPAIKNIPLQPSYKWLKIAAVLLVIAGGGWLAYMLNTTTNPPAIADVAKNKPLKTAPHDIVMPATPSVVNNSEKNQVIAKADVEKASDPGIELKQETHRKTVAVKKSARSAKTYYAKGLFSYNKPKDFICNSTPCPIEICIIQSVKCKNDRPSAISTCSVLEPDQSGQLHYKAFGKIAKNCKAMVDEIRITRMSTGETIVLNDHSKPSTAQDFFNHITGKKKGEVFAGVFHTDCNNHADDCGLTFDSNYGNLILQ